MAISSHTPHPSFGRRSTSGRSFAGGFTALTSSCPRGTFGTFVESQFWGSCHKLPIHVALGISSQSSIMAKCACWIYECHCSLSKISTCWRLLLVTSQHPSPNHGDFQLLLVILLAESQILCRLPWFHSEEAP